MPNLVLIPSGTTQEVDAEVEEGSIVKRSMRPSVVPSTQALSIRALEIQRRRTLRAFKPVKFGAVSQNLPHLIREKLLQPGIQTQNVDFNAFSLLLTDPPKKPVGTVTLPNDEPLAGQRLRSGDMHRLKVYVRGERLDLFGIYFRFRALSGTKVYEKRLNSGLVNLVSGTDQTTQEESLTGTILIYSNELVVDTQTEYRFELELDDQLGYRTGVVADGSFTVFPDSPP
jgi:hypothetical protein